MVKLKERNLSEHAKKDLMELEERKNEILKKRNEYQSYYHDYSDKYSDLVDEVSKYRHKFFYSVRKFKAKQKELEDIKVVEKEAFNAFLKYDREVADELKEIEDRSNRIKYGLTTKQIYELNRLDEIDREIKSLKQKLNSCFDEKKHLEHSIVDLSMNNTDIIRHYLYDVK